MSLIQSPRSVGSGVKSVTASSSVVYLPKERMRGKKMEK